MYEIWIATPEIPNMKAFESPTGNGVLDNWKAMVRSSRTVGSVAVLKVIDDGGETILGKKVW